MGTGFDLSALRAQFPILSRTVHDKPLAYLDSAASAQKPLAVIAAMEGAMRGSYANVHRGLHTLANETTTAYEAARASVAKLLGARYSDEIVFTKGATAAINIVAHGIGATIVPGDEIVLTVMEHHANIVPWHFLRARGAVLKFLDIDADGRLDLGALDAALTPRTKMLALTHMSNVLGVVTPAQEIVAIAHAKGVPVLLDGCQAAVHTRVDVAELGVDFYAASGHKLYGPTGIGVLYGRRERLAALPPFEGGGEMIDQVTLDTVTYNDPPHRFEAGTPPILEAIGLGAAVEWFMAQDISALHRHEKAMHDMAFEGLRGMNFIALQGCHPDKSAVISFTMAGAHPHDVAQVLDRYGVAVRAGHHCAQPLMARLGVTATARASVAAYTSPDDIAQFLDALTRAHKLFQ